MAWPSAVCGRARLLMLAIVSVAVAGGGVGGFWLGQLAGIEETIAEGDASPLQTSQQRHTLALFEPRGAGRLDIDSLGAKIGEMQAELLRLNALGERLVQKADLNPDVFDFANPPPQGGPDAGDFRDYDIKELANELGGVLALVNDRKRKLTLLEESIMERDFNEEAMPSGWPVRTGYITSKFGYRYHPIKGRRSFHSGVDFAGKRGSPVVAVADGLVTFSGRKGGYGRMVEIRHLDGLVTRYAHNTKNLVKEGQLIEQGQKIATIGSSGSATGPHVHFEVLKDGKPVNPKRYVGSKPSARSTASKGSDSPSG